MGPGRTLATLARQSSPPGPRDPIVTSLRHAREAEADPAAMLRAIGQLWTSGIAINWSALSAGERRRRVQLPTYPFERQRFVLGPAAAPVAAPAVRTRQRLDEWFSVVSWKRVPRSRGPRLSPAFPTPGRWLLFADPRGVATPLRRYLTGSGRDVVVVEPGRAFERMPDGTYRIQPNDPADYRRLFEALKSINRLPETIAHCWTAAPAVEAPQLTTDEHLQRGFYSLLFLAQAIEIVGSTRPLRLGVVSTDLVDVTGDETVCPAKAAIFGPARVIPTEIPQVTTRVIDLVAAEWQDADDRRFASLVDSLASAAHRR